MEVLVAEGGGYKRGVMVVWGGMVKEIEGGGGGDDDGGIRCGISR